MTESPRRNILVMNLSLLTGLAFSEKRKKKWEMLDFIDFYQIEGKLTLSLSGLGVLGPHLLDGLQDHVAVAVERLHAAEKLLVVPAKYKNRL